MRPDDRGSEEALDGRTTEGLSAAPQSNQPILPLEPQPVKKSAGSAEERISPDEAHLSYSRRFRSGGWERRRGHLRAEVGESGIEMVGWVPEEGSDWEPVPGTGEEDEGAGEEA